jgi:hypothetical protein
MEPWESRELDAALLSLAVGAGSDRELIGTVTVTLEGGEQRKLLVERRGPMLSFGGVLLFHTAGGIQRWIQEYELVHGVRVTQHGFVRA